MIKKIIFSLIIVFLFSSIIAIQMRIQLNRTGYHLPKHKVAIVFGAAVKSSGQLFGASLYRVNTAIELYQKGIVQKIIFTGSDRGYPAMGEATAMGIHARRNGIPESDIILDNHGHDTEKSIINAKKTLLTTPDLGKEWESSLFLSQGYHLARIQWIARRYGFLGYTYPAKNNKPLNREPFFILREIAAYINALFTVFPEFH